MNAPRMAVLGLAALLLLPAGARAQEYSRFTGSFALLNTQPLGELSTGPGLGVMLGGAYALDRMRILRLYGEFRASIYDQEQHQVCFSTTVGCRVVLDLTTSYSTLYVGLGPQVVFPLGPVRLAFDGTMGLGAFTAASSVSGIDQDQEDFGNTTNYEDHTFAWSAGGELRIPVAAQIDLALGTRYQHNGVVSYLREGGIIDNPDGSISYDPQRTEANMLAITIGVTLRPLLEDIEP